LFPDHHSDRIITITGGGRGGGGAAAAAVGAGTIRITLGFGS